MKETRTFYGTFWSGALLGAAVVWLLEEIRLRRRANEPRLVLVHSADRNPRVPLKREEGAGDPSLLTTRHAETPTTFERSGGAPGGSQPAEVHEAPGHPGQRLDHSDPSQQVRSARVPDTQPEQDRA